MRCPRGRGRLRPRGESLIEVLIAVFVFITAFLAVLGVFPASTRAVARARDMNFATQLAERVMEDQRAKGFNTLNTTINATGPISGAKAQINHINNGAAITSDYIYSVQVTPIGTSAFDVLVTMTWTGDAGSVSAANGSNFHSLQLESEVGQ